MRWAQGGETFGIRKAVVLSNEHWVDHLSVQPASVSMY